MLRAIVFVVIVLFGGCSHKVPTLQERKHIATSLIDDKNIIQKDIKTDSFNLFSYQKVSQSCKNIRVYIEGDGLAWVSKNIISKDPTPLDPIALKLMLVDDSNCKIYLARPCQYIESHICQENYWTNERFSKKIIDSYIKTLDEIKKEFSNSAFDLVGYSGGATISLLVASFRDDIATITTIAGNLDIAKWADLHHIVPLNGSLNPVDFSDKLESIPQYHLIGSTDTIISYEIFNSYRNRFKDRSNIHHKLYNTTHNRGWDIIFRDFLQKNIF